MHGFRVAAGGTLCNDRGLLTRLIIDICTYVRARAYVQGVRELAGYSPAVRPDSKEVDRERCGTRCREINEPLTHFLPPSLLLSE